MEEKIDAGMPQEKPKGQKIIVWVIIIVLVLLIGGGILTWYFLIKIKGNIATITSLTPSPSTSAGPSASTGSVKLTPTTNDWFEFSYPTGWNVFKDFGAFDSGSGGIGTIYSSKTYIGKGPIVFYPSEGFPSEMSIFDYMPDPNNNPSAFKSLAMVINETKAGMKVLSEEKTTINNIEITKLLGRYENMEIGPENYDELTYLFGYTEPQNNINHVVEFKSTVWESNADNQFTEVKSIMEEMIKTFQLRTSFAPLNEIMNR
jgi:hypothetical protein